MKVLLLVAAALAVGCVGEIDDTLPVVPLACGSKATLLPQAGVRRLTRAEYSNTVRDVLAVTPPDLTALPDDAVLRSFTTTIGQSLNAAAAGKYLDAAELVAGRALEKTPLACSADEVACARSYLARTGERLIRRPLTSAELDHFVGIFTTARVDDDLQTSAGVALSALLSSPQFLFLNRDGGSPYAIAAHLAYSLWQTAPDAELLQAASQGKLATREGIAAQVARLTSDPRAEVPLHQFIDEWLGLGLITKANVKEAHPDATPEILEALAAESRAFARDALLSQKDYRKLFVSNRVFRNSALSAFYGDQLGKSDAITAYTVDPSEKSFGLLSQAGVLIAASKNENASIIYRGKYVRTRMLCGEIELPPAGTPTGLPEVIPNQTSRERIAQHTSAATCQACHTQLNPIGFSLLHFDGSGRWQDDENGTTIDASAHIDGLGEVDGGYSLSRALAASDEAATCVARTVVTMARAERLRGGDSCLSDAFGEHFAASGYDVNALVAAVVREQAYAMGGAR